MLRGQKRAFREYCRQHRALYCLFSRWFERRSNRAMRKARRQWGIDDNLVVFSSYNMRTYDDNPRYICEALHARRPRTKIVWLFRDVPAARAKCEIPDWVRCVEWRTPLAFFYLGRARVVVDNWQKPDWLRLGRDQVYLFSPHHDRSFKSGGFLKKDRLYSHLVESRASVVMTGSDFNKRFLRLAARFRGPFLDVGLPRNDLLLRDDPADEARIRGRLHIDVHTRILLYAPTYRDAERREGRREKVLLDIGHVLDVLEEATHEHWICLARAHYLSVGLEMDGQEKSPRLVDVTGYPEMAELLRVCDALISDYSCAAGDFALRGKPIWLYVADIDEYARHSRALFVNPLDTPYWCAKTPFELDALIRRTTPERAARNCREILEYYGAHESGAASERAADYICARLDGDSGRERNGRETPLPTPAWLWYNGAGGGLRSTPKVGPGTDRTKRGAP